MALTLVIGNKNYSSWSMRPWLALAHHKIPFEEVLIPLDQPDSKAKILNFSPAGKVPVLLDGEARLWESIAILVHLGERFADAKLWPGGRARAHAFAIAAEMHAGFAHLRRHCPMNLWRPVQRLALTPEVEKDVARVTEIWRGARERVSAGGEFLFGEFSAADCMYAPVAARIRTYAIEVDPVSAAYVEAIHALPAFHSWREAALKETWVLPHDEPDWPQVKRIHAGAQASRTD